VSAVVQQQLFCTGCRHVLCAACKAGHSSHVCAVCAKDPGPYTLQQLQDVVSDQWLQPQLHLPALLQPPTLSGCVLGACI